jgi:hypothetical protein
MATDSEIQLGPCPEIVAPLRRLEPTPWQHDAASFYFAAGAASRAPALARWQAATVIQFVLLIGLLSWIVLRPLGGVPLNANVVPPAGPGNPAATATEANLPRAGTVSPAPAVPAVPGGLWQPQSPPGSPSLGELLSQLERFTPQGSIGFVSTLPTPPTTQNTTNGLFNYARLSQDIARGGLTLLPQSQPQYQPGRGLPTPSPSDGGGSLAVPPTSGLHPSTQPPSDPDQP